MKKTIAFLTVVATMTGLSAAAANAAPLNFPGSVSGTCSLTVTDGSLPLGAGLVSSLSSTDVGGSAGLIQGKCNVAAPTLTVTSAGVFDTAPTPAVYAGVTQSYKFVDATTGMFDITALDGSADDQATGGILANNAALSMTASSLAINAKIAAPTGTFLAAGNYNAKYVVLLSP
jgi:hypothetical protein